jgi:MFS family permease
VLVASRVVQAAGGAMMIPTTLGLILPAFPVSERATAVGIWSAVGGVAAALGPPIGGVLVELSWRWIFIVNVPIGLITALLAARSLAEVREPAGAPRPDGVGALQPSPESACSRGPSSRAPTGAGAIPGSSAASPPRPRSSSGSPRARPRHPAPVIEPSMLRVRNFALANLAAMIFFAGFGAMLLAGVLYLTQVWDYSILHAGVALSPGPLTAALSAPSGRLGGRIGQRPIAALGGLTFAGSFALLLAVAGASPDYAGAFLPDFLLAGAGVGMVLGTLPAAATASLPPSRFATGTAVFGMARQLGAAIGVAVLVALLADPAPDALLGALRHGWAFMVGTGLGTAALSLALGPVRAEEATARKPDVAPQPQPAAAK